MSEANLTITCPNCEKHYRVEEASLGGRAKCQNCGTSFTLEIRLDETLDFPIRSASGTSSSQRSAEKPAAPPDKLGRYEIRQRLGAGAFGVVYRAYDPVLERDVALKVPQGASLETAEARTRFMREPKAAAQLRHQNIVPVHDVGFVDDQCFIVSSFIEGQTLADKLRSREVNVEQAVEIIVKLAEALHYAHTQGIVHRDVKPGNVMIDDKGEPLLMDFGLAHWDESQTQLTQQGTILGTPAYMSPEQAGGGGEIGSASDQYSLACMLYETLCGQPPFKGPVMSVIYQHRHEPPPSPTTLNATVPPLLERICLKALAKQPVDRYPDLAQMARVMRSVTEAKSAVKQALPVAKPLNEEPPSTSAPTPAPVVVPPQVEVAAAKHPTPSPKPESPLTAVRRWVRRPQVIGVAAAAIIFFIAIGVIVYVATNNGTIQIEVVSEDETVKADSVKIEIDGDTVMLADLENPINLRAKEHKIHVEGKDFETLTDRFVVKRGENEKLIVTLRKTATGTSPVPIHSTDADPSQEAALTNSLGMKFTLIDPAKNSDKGRFVMGSPLSEPGHDYKVRDRFTTSWREKWPVPDGDQELQHAVVLTKPYYVGITEVTEEQYHKLMDGQDRVDPSLGLNYPAIVHGYRAGAFVRKLNEIPEEKSAGRHYRLPTEAEWEYACRAGSKTAYSFGDDVAQLDEYGWSKQNTGAVREVGRKKPNAWGLYDMHGNVAEWCLDYYELYPANEQTDPIVGGTPLDYHGRSHPDNWDTTWRVLRGGAYSDVAEACRSAWRLRGQPRSMTSRFTGFRVVIAEPVKPNDGRVPETRSDDPISSSSSVRLIAELTGHTDQINRAVFSADGTLVVSASKDKTVRLWNVAEKRLVATLTGHASSVSSVAISPDGRQAVSSSSDETVRLWDLEKHTEVRVLEGHNAYVRDIVFAPDGKHALSGGDGSGRRVNLVYWDLAGDNHKQWKTTGIASHVCISADGKTALTTNYTNENVKIWDVESGMIRAIFNKHGGRAGSVSMSRDGKLAASGATLEPGESDKALIWNVETQDVLFEGPETWQVDLAPNGKLVLVNLGKGSLGIWSPGNTEFQTLQLGTASFRALKFAPDGRRFLTDDEDNVIKIWEISKTDDSTTTAPNRADEDSVALDDLLHWTPMTTSGTADDVHREGQGGWIGSGGMIRCMTSTSGWLRSNEKYDNFELSLEFKLPPGANCGIQVRTPEQGHLSRVGMEIQVVDEAGAKLADNQRTGAIHNAVGHSKKVLKPANEWNSMAILCDRAQVRITLNGTVVVDAQVTDHAELKDRPRTGYIGLSNWRGKARGAEFRNVRIRRLESD